MTDASFPWTLLSMHELAALEFISAVTEVRRLATILEQGTDLNDAPIQEPEVRARMAGTIESLRGHLSLIGDASAWVAANRLHERLSDPERPITFSELRQCLQDIERRFADYLGFIRLFVVRSEQLPLLGSGVELLGEPTASRFTKVWFDCEEAAKCLLVLRPTAAVFHCMRMLEIGIHALAARLGIPDPVKPAERNWGIFLRVIRGKIDLEYPASKRLPSSEGAFMESLYATLDAVKNPWRNETMHVEGVYTDAEARFILANTIGFIQKMATEFDENGQRVDPLLIAGNPG